MHCKDCAACAASLCSHTPQPLLHLGRVPAREVRPIPARTRLFCRDPTASRQPPGGTPSALTTATLRIWTVLTARRNAHRDTDYRAATGWWRACPLPAAHARNGTKTRLAGSSHPHARVRADTHSHCYYTRTATTIQWQARRWILATTIRPHGACAAAAFDQQPASRYFFRPPSSKLCAAVVAL